jgi:hypothetical protein
LKAGISGRKRHPTFFEIQASDALHEEVRENSDFRGLVTSALISEVDGQTRQLPIVEHWHETARHDVVVNDVKRLDNNP